MKRVSTALFVLLSVLLFVLWAVSTTTAAAQDKPPAFQEARLLSEQIAEAAAKAALAACTQMGYRVGVSVASRDGHLLYFIRHPLAGPHVIAISIAKAYTSAVTGKETKVLEKLPQLDDFERMTTIEGGVPVKVGGYVYGGLGVSGALPEDDGMCARAGLKNVPKDLERGE